MVTRVHPFPTFGALVEPLRPMPFEFHLTDDERRLYDSVAQEHTGICGTIVDYYPLDQLGTKVDPLYNEPVERKYKGPFRMRAFVAYPDEEPEADEKGLRSVWTAELWIPRLNVEQEHMPDPFMDDIVRVWRMPYFDRVSVNAQNETEDIPGAGLYFDVTKVHDDGHLFDNSAFVGFQLDLKRRTEDTPERRLRG